MATRRIPIPKKIANEVLFRNQNVCCVCHESGVQIHHIDGDDNNNNLSNLCVLCLRHHDEASSKNRLTKNLSPELLEKYKSVWEGFVAQRRRKAIERKPKEKLGDEMIKFEIKKTTYSLPMKKNKREINEQIDFLYNLHVFEDCTLEIIKRLSFIRWFLSKKQINCISERIPEFFWQFIEPKDVPMWKRDEREIKEAVLLLIEFADCVSLINQDKDALRKICDALLTFFKIVAMYKRKQIGLEIQKGFKKINKEVIANIKNKRKRETITKIIKKTEKEIQIIWKKSKKFSILPPSELVILEFS